MRTSTTIMSIAALSVAATLLSAAGAQAKTIFVDANSGNNGASGTQEAPVKSISVGVSKAASGDVVSVNGGNYNESIGINKSSITVQATPGQRPVVKGGFDIQGNYVKIAGFDISGAENGILVKKAHHVT
ncbi:MAG: DUF1565 domain-containing protein, partial [Chroococcidiopsis sp.]